jgi:hypothetical protein
VNKKLIINVALAALAAGVGGFAGVLAASNQPTTKAGLAGVGAAAGWGFLRAAAGVIATRSKIIPTIPVDK